VEFGNGRERDLDEWRVLLVATDPRLRFRHLYQPPGPNLAIMEAVWDE
jgi:hypothetical protein